MKNLNPTALQFYENSLLKHQGYETKIDILFLEDFCQL